MVVDNIDNLFDLKIISVVHFLMGVELCSWRNHIGIFNARITAKSRCCKMIDTPGFVRCIIFVSILTIISLLLIICGDVEVNPGPRYKG